MTNSHIEFYILRQDVQTPIQEIVYKKTLSLSNKELMKARTEGDIRVKCTFEQFARFLLQRTQTVKVIQRPVDNLLREARVIKLGALREGAIYEVDVCGRTCSYD